MNFDYVFQETVIKSGNAEDDDLDVSADEGTGREPPRSTEKKQYIDSADMSVREVYPEESND